MAGDVTEKKSSGGAGPSWKRPRTPIRIDMTPMVDIAFLLLIFFMVTTVFRLPQAMEMVLPENDPNNPPPTTKVYKNKLITFLVTERDSLAYFIGDSPPRPLVWDSLRPVLLERREIIGDSLTVLARIHKKAKYESMVNLIDEFNVAKTTRFSIDHFTTFEDSLLRMAGFQTSGPADLPEPEYATGPAETE
ncbi:biopolymer transporter ExbD [candidate division KSB1 bacterium]|nr:biopolymer transporter ExbD [candidate division KSB1 bacterium]